MERYSVPHKESRFLRFGSFWAITFLYNGIKHPNSMYMFLHISIYMVSI